jgi:hypothetical protein
VRGGGRANPPPGGPPPATPYAVSVDHLIEANAQSVRLVLRRGGVVFADASANSSNLNIPFAQRPQPGDIVDVYRPKTAPAPTYSVTIPQISAVFDASADLIAVTAPAAGSETTYACHVYSCSNENFRSRRDLPAGQTVFDFKLSQGSSLPLDIRPDDVVNADWNSADYTLDFEFQAQPGDLVAPVQSFKLPSKLKISALMKALKKGYKIKLTSNEAGSAKLKLGKLASVTGSVKPGSNSLKLKFSKSGKKAIKKLAAQGKHAKSRSISLTSVVTDASGNASTIVKKTKLKP